MIIKLKSLLVEQQGVEGQYYDLGKDFFNFKRMVDGADEQIKQKYENAINAKLAGKRIRAKASRGYKQYVKIYEFDVSRITLDDYYDNFVIVAHDNTTPKAREFFLKSGSKIQILGPATGQAAPQKPGAPKPSPAPIPTNPKKNATKAQREPMAIAPAGRTPGEEPMKEDQHNHEAYPIDAIGQDIKPWLPSLLLKPETAMRDFITGLGWMQTVGRGKTMAIFELKIPVDFLKPQVTPEVVKQVLAKVSKPEGTIATEYKLKKMEMTEGKDEWKLQIIKTMTDRTAI